MSNPTATSRASACKPVAYAVAMTIRATTSSTTKTVSMNARTRTGKRGPTTASIPSANALSVDMATPDGSMIPIEMRSEDEVFSFAGVRTAPRFGKAWNPAFDVTPASLISAIVTEEGALRAPFGPALEAAVAAKAEHDAAARLAQYATPATVPMQPANSPADPPGAVACGRNGRHLHRLGRGYGRGILLRIENKIARDDRIIGIGSHGCGALDRTLDMTHLALVGAYVEVHFRHVPPYLLLAHLTQSFHFQREVPLLRGHHRHFKLHRYQRR